MQPMKLASTLCNLTWLANLLKCDPLRPEELGRTVCSRSGPFDLRKLHPAPDRYKKRKRCSKSIFGRRWIQGDLSIAVDRKTGKIIGSSRYFWYGPEPGEMEIGWTFLARSHWGGVYNSGD